MLRVIHSMPEECPDCGASNIGDRLMLMREEGNTVICNHCGILMVLRVERSEDEELEEDRSRGRCSEGEVTASFAVCPHCSTANAIYAAGGDEWCGACGLDPNKEKYPPEDLAKLWNPGSTIQSALYRGRPRPEGPMFRFLTTLCGPHCGLADECDQGAKDFRQCYKEEFLGLPSPQAAEPEEAVVQGRKKSKKALRREKRKRMKAERKLAAKKSQTAVLECASSGWYERNLKYRNETPNPQESTHTGGGSGT